jgi:hypothetical protein
VLYYDNGMRLEGKWVSGIPNGKCTLYQVESSKKVKDKAAVIYSGICKDGKVLVCNDRPNVPLSYSPLLSLGVLVV